MWSLWINYAWMLQKRPNVLTPKSSHMDFRSGALGVAFNVQGIPFSVTFNTHGNPFIIIFHCAGTPLLTMRNLWLWRICWGMIFDLNSHNKFIYITLFRHFWACTPKPNHLYIPMSQSVILAFRTAQTCWGMESRRSLKVCCAIRYQDVGSRSFKTCRLWGVAAVDRTC